MENVIEVKRLSKSYKGKVAVDALDFTVRKGEIFGLIGPNGAGKTTSIECLLGMKKRDQGLVKILGLNPDKDSKKIFTDIGVQFQSAFYPDHIKVKEACMMKACLYKEVMDYHELLDHFELIDKKEAYVSHLSGGEKQKLSVLLSLINKPKLIILDELTTGLDPQARRQVWNYLKDLQTQGISILLTSHYMDEIEYLCDRILIIQNGKMVFRGPIKEVQKKFGSEKLEDIYLHIINKEKKDYESIKNPL